jgi:hypothetical protein
MEATVSSETSVLAGPTRHHIPGDGIQQVLSSIRSPIPPFPVENHHAFAHSNSGIVPYNRPRPSASVTAHRPYIRDISDFSLSRISGHQDILYCR